MKRPDQPRFDHFSRHFERIDARLQRFASQYDWKLIQNPLRKPERDLHRFKEVNPALRMRFMFGIYVEGNWLTLDPALPLLHTAGITAIYDPLPGARCIRRSVFVEHAAFDSIEAGLDDLLHRAAHTYEQWPLPVFREEKGWQMPEGWRAVTRETLANFIL